MKEQPKSEAKERRMSQEQKWLAYVSKLRNEHDEEITRLKAELEKDRELRKELVDSLHALLKYSRRWLDEYTNEIIQSLIEKAKNL